MSYFDQFGMSLDAGQPVEWDHPLNDSLVSWWLVSPLGHPAYRGGSTLYDLCKRYHGTLTGGPLWYGERGRRGGRGSIFFDGTDDYVDCGVISQIASVTNATLTGWMYKPTTGTRVCFGQYTDPYRFGVSWDSSGNTVYNLAENGSASYPSYTASPTTGWNHFVIAYDGSLSGTSRTACYLNGMLQSLSAGGADPAASLAATANQTAWRFGMDNSLGDRFFGGQIDDVRLYTRTLNATQVRQLYELSQRGYPGLLRRRRGIGYFVSSGGSPGSYSIEAESGTFTLTGGSANLIAARKISSESGTFTLTGGSANLTKGFKVSAESGTFTLTGGSATLTAARLISAESGTFTLTGGDTSLLKGRTLTAASGTFAVTGGSANLIAARKITASSGTFTLTGGATTLLKGRTLTAESGTFALIGGDATLTAARKLSAESGTFTLTGGAANLTRGLKLSAESGTFALIGGDATLTRSRLLSAESGTFTLTGGSATFSLTSLDAALLSVVAVPSTAIQSVVSVQPAIRCAVVPQGVIAATGQRQSAISVYGRVQGTIEIGITV